jgi:hypothetical protein
MTTVWYVRDVTKVLYSLMLLFFEKNKETDSTGWNL